MFFDKRTLSSTPVKEYTSSGFSGHQNNEFSLEQKEVSLKTAFTSLEKVKSEVIFLNIASQLVVRQPLHKYKIA